MPVALRNAPRRPLQGLSPFWVWRTNIACVPYQGYAHACLGSWGLLVPWPSGAVFLGGAVPVTLKNAPRGPSQNLDQFRVRRTNSPAPPTKVVPTRLGAPGAFWHPDLRGSIFWLGGAVWIWMSLFISGAKNWPLLIFCTLSNRR